VIAAGDEPRGVRHALDRERLLDRARHPEQRRQLAVAGARDGGIGGVRLAGRLVEALDGDRAGAWLVVLACLDVRLDHLARGDLAFADRAGEGSCRTAGEWWLVHESTVHEPVLSWARGTRPPLTGTFPQRTRAGIVS
jgi:hypothetical protein